MNDVDKFFARTNAAESKMKEAFADIHRLCHELQELNVRLSRSNDRLLKKADMLAQLETKLRDHDRRLCKELDEAETDEERAMLRGMLAGLNIAVTDVIAIGHLI